MVDIVRSAHSVRSPCGKLSQLKVEDYCFDQSDITILADLVTAATLIAGGLPNVISVVPNVVYYFPYHPHSRYTLIGTLSPDGTGAYDPDAFVELDLFSGNTGQPTTVKVFDVLTDENDLTCWHTSSFDARR